MAWYAKFDGVDGSAKATDGTSDTFVFAEKYTLDVGASPSGTRLFVGNLTMNSSDYGPEIGDEVLVVFEHSQETHPDFLWAPDGIL